MGLASGISEHGRRLYAMYERRFGKNQPTEGIMNEHIEQFFAFEHLPPQLQAVSKPFAILARTLIGTLPRNPEREVALRKLLESKDAAVRAYIAKDVT